MTDVAVLLCAGWGSRLRPLTDDRPKALIEVGSETILARAVRLLLASGVRELVVATGYREDAVRRALADCPASVTFCYNEAFDRTQNAVSLHLCRPAVRDRAFLKLDGDVLFHSGILERLLTSRADLTAAVERRDDLGDEEMKVLVDGERILAFGKRLDPRTSYGESIGIERLSSAAATQVFDALGEASARGRTDSLLRGYLWRVARARARRARLGHQRLALDRGRHRRRLGASTSTGALRRARAAGCVAADALTLALRLLRTWGGDLGGSSSPGRSPLGRHSGRRPRFGDEVVKAESPAHESAHVVVRRAGLCGWFATPVPASHSKSGASS